MSCSSRRRRRWPPRPSWPGAPWLRPSWPEARSGGPFSTWVNGPSLPPLAEAERDAGGDQPGRGQADVLPDAGQVPGGDHRVGRQAVYLWLVEQQEERPGAADAVVRVVQVELGVVLSGRAQVRHPQRGPLAELVQRAELDGIGRAGLGAGGLHPRTQPVVAQRALVRLPVLLAPGD